MGGINQIFHQSNKESLSLLHYQSEFKNPPPTFSRCKRFSEIYIDKKKGIIVELPTISFSLFGGAYRNGRERVELKAKEYCVPPPPPLGFSPPPTAFKNDATCL